MLCKTILTNKFVFRQSLFENIEEYKESIKKGKCFLTWKYKINILLDSLIENIKDFLKQSSKIK